MDRLQALRTLGLEENASPDQIKIAYRESAQILHPDKFANNPKLQERASEQFKNLQEAYDLLKKAPSAGRSAKSSWGGNGQTSSSQTGNAYNGYCANNPHLTKEAKLAGLAAARVQLVEQRDVLCDEQKRSIWTCVLGVLALLLFRRFTWVIAIAGTAAVYGFTSAITTTGNLRALDKHLEQISQLRRKIEQDDID